MERKILDEYDKYVEIEMVTGSSSASYIRVVNHSKAVQEGSIGTGCNARPRMMGAKWGNITRLRSENRRLCPKCTREWPLDVIRKFEE